jgi:hypothetical protein
VLLTKVFSDEQFERALDSWEWIGLDEKKPVLASLFGDVFFASKDGWWFLDLIEGSLTHRWLDRDALQQDLDTEDGQVRRSRSGSERSTPSMLWAGPSRTRKTMPATASALFIHAKERACLWQIRPLETLRINSHFFVEDEIEFDLDPRAIGDEQHFEVVRVFLATLGRALQKPVGLCIEGGPPRCPDDLRYEPEADTVLIVSRF